MNVDWGALRAVVLESDDWGFCAWCPDDAAHRALAGLPVFRSAPGLRYGRSTLETAEDVRALSEVLAAARGGDGFPPVLQANTIVANPDYDAMDPASAAGEMPLVRYPEFPSRWARPGLREEVDRARVAGLWWPELHGLHHLPESAWRTALARGDADARRAFELQSPACEAGQGSGEYDPFEPSALREGNLTRAVRTFEEIFGTKPGSLCPPDYRWDDFLEAQSEALGIAVLQGKSEQHDQFAGRLRRLWRRRHWPRFRNRQLYMPSRIAFEPVANDPRTGVGAAHAAVRAAWRRGQPAVVSTHRVNYAHLDADLSRAGRAALHDLLVRLTADHAVFLTDAEVGQIVDHGGSVRPLGPRRVRVHAAGGRLDLVSPAGAKRARFIRGTGVVEATVEQGTGEWPDMEGTRDVEWSLD